MTRPVSKLSTGIPGLDEILHGGLIPRQCYLVAGGPGLGKTTVGLHFLSGGDEKGRLFVSLGEAESQLRSNAENSGLSMDNVFGVIDLRLRLNRFQLKNVQSHSSSVVK